jgi:hypothetical protein
MHDGNDFSIKVNRIFHVAQKNCLLSHDDLKLSEIEDVLNTRKTNEKFALKNYKNVKVFPDVEQTTPEAM